MAAAHVQSTTSNSFTSTTHVLTITGVAAGSAIIAAFGWSDSGISVSSVVDDKSGSWTVKSPTTGGTRAGTVAYVLNSAGGDVQVTITYSSAPGTSRLILHEASGIATASAEDGYAANGQVNPGTATDACVSTNITTTVAGDYLFGACFDIGTNSDQATGTGWTTGVANIASEYQIQGAAATIQATFTEGGASSENTTHILALKAAAPSLYPSFIINNMRPMAFVPGLAR